MPFPQLEMIEGHDMHQLGYQGAGIQIAVLDAGFKNTDQLAAFESLFDNNQILGTWILLRRKVLFMKIIAMEWQFFLLSEHA